jgi:hypothetical protein
MNLSDQCYVCECIHVDGTLVAFNNNVYCQTCAPMCHRCDNVITEVEVFRMQLRSIDRGFVCGLCYDALFHIKTEHPENDNEDDMSTSSDLYCDNCDAQFTMGYRAECRGCLCDECYAEAEEEEANSMCEDTVFQGIMQKHFKELADSDDDDSDEDDDEGVLV